MFPFMLLFIHLIVVTTTGEKFRKSSLDES